MQAAVDSHGSSNSNKSNGTTSTSTATVVLEPGPKKEDNPPAVTLTGAPPAEAQPVSVLRQRLSTACSAASETAVQSQSGVGGAQRNGNVHKMSAAAIACGVGSVVEQIPATPTPSPQASPARKAIPIPLATSKSNKGAASVAANNSKSSNSSSNPNSNIASNSTTSSVIATPILKRYGNPFASIDISSKIDAAAAAAGGGGGREGGGGGGDRRISSTAARNDILATKKLPLAAAVEYTTTITAAKLEELTPTPLTPTPTTSNSHSPATTSTASSSTSASASASPSATPASTTPATSPSSSPSMEAQLLQWKDMPKHLQFNPYVLKGYRPLQTFKGCLLSLFYWHNETINILTHAIPIVYILAIVPGLMPWEKEYRFLSFCHLFGSVAPWCGSFVYHLFMNIEKGENVYYRLLKLDMVGIWVSQSFGALPLVTATTFCFSFKWKWFIILSYCLLSLWGLYKALTASSPWQRRLCFAMPFTMRSILTFLRTLGLVGGSRVALPHVYLQDGVSILGGAIGAMRIPEKWFPGLVDFYLNSHNIMHVLVVVAVYSMHKATIKDFEWMSATTCENINNATDKAIESVISSNVEL